MQRRSQGTAHRRYGDRTPHAAGWQSVEWRRDSRSGEWQDLPRDHEAHRWRTEAGCSRLHRIAPLRPVADLASAHRPRLKSSADAAARLRGLAARRDRLPNVERRYGAKLPEVCEPDPTGMQALEHIGRGEASQLHLALRGVGIGTGERIRYIPGMHHELRCATL